MSIWAWSQSRKKLGNRKSSGQLECDVKSPVDFRGKYLVEGRENFFATWKHLMPLVGAKSFEFHLTSFRILQVPSFLEKHPSKAPLKASIKAVKKLLKKQTALLSFSVPSSLPRLSRHLPWIPSQFSCKTQQKPFSINLGELPSLVARATWHSHIIESTDKRK